MRWTESAHGHAMPKSRKPKPETKPILGVTMGDPAGIGPEVVAKALAGREVGRVCRPLVIGSLPVMEQTVRSLGLPLRVEAVAGHGPLGGRGVLPVLDPLDRPLGRFRMGAAAADTGAASLSFISKAVKLVEIGCLDGIVTGPISKEAINLAGCKHPGHTELLADLTRSQEVGMMILGGPFKIMFATTHVAVRDLSAALTLERVGRSIRLAHRALREYFGIARPKIGLAALNPHAGKPGCSAMRSDGAFCQRSSRPVRSGFTSAIRCRRIPCSERPSAASMTAWWPCTTIRA